MKKVTMAALVAALALLALLAGCQDASAAHSLLSFADEDELAATIADIQAAGLAERASVAKLQGFDSMLDAFAEVDSLGSQAELDAYLAEKAAFLALTERKAEDGSVQRIVNLKINPAFAAVANEAGEVEVGGRVYRLLEAGDAEALSAKLLALLSEGGSKRIVASVFDWIPSGIPMFANANVGPFYPSAYFTTSIAGRKTVVQVWKGYCPIVWGIDGGVGAEVGLYNTPWYSKSIWFPDWQHPRPMSYQLIRRDTGAVVLSVARTTWWLNSWVKFEILPIMGSDYTLVYTINGVTRSW